MENMAHVKCINEVTNISSSESWLDHWKKHSNQYNIYCAEKNCMTTTELVGAHVQKAVSADDQLYIIPLCREHKASETVLDIIDSLSLVLANKNETCSMEKSAF